MRIASCLHVAALAACFALPAAAQMQMPMGTGAMQHKMAERSTSLILDIYGKHTVLTLEQLAALPHKTVTVHNIHTNADETYTGVPLADLLSAHGAKFSKDTQKDMLQDIIVAAGTDNYSVIYSTVEVFPDYHTGDVIVADSLNGKPLTDDGALKLISTEDKHPMRWVRNLATITLKSVE
jgi:hypothetical protein